jgi:hypothetical protein
MYDTKCWNLAEDFLDDSDKPHTPEDTRQLAQTIQDAIENWLAGFAAGNP